MSETALEEEIEAVPTTEGESPKAGGGKKRLIIIAAGGVGLLLAIGAGFYFTNALNHITGHKDAVVEAPPKPLVFFDLPDFLVNLNAGGRRANFLKLSVSLEVATPEDALLLKEMLPRIVDNFQIYLRELRVEDLRGSGGIYRLREELLARVNAAAAPVKVSDVLFREMLVQ
jgi:flagellar FliL protein